MAIDYKTAAKDKQAEARRIMNSSQLKKCHGIIHTATVASAAGGVIPLPVADAIPISVAQVTMVISLGKVFNQKITESAAKAAIAAAAATFAGRNLVKMIPVIGWGISAAVAAGVTEAIGWTAAVDYAKSAKNAWDNEHYSNGDERASASRTQTESSDQAQEDGINWVDDMTQRAQALLTGEVDDSIFMTELKTVIREIEKRLEELPDDHCLRELYEKLADLL